MKKQLYLLMSLMFGLLFMIGLVMNTRGAKAASQANVVKGAMNGHFGIDQVWDAPTDEFPYQYYVYSGLPYDVSVGTSTRFTKSQIENCYFTIEESGVASYPIAVFVHDKTTGNKINISGSNIGNLANNFGVKKLTESNRTFLSEKYPDATGFFTLGRIEYCASGCFSLRTLAGKVILFSNLKGLIDHNSWVFNEIDSCWENDSPSDLKCLDELYTSTEPLTQSEKIIEFYSEVLDNRCPYYAKYIDTAVNDNITLPDEVERYGYDFLGWKSFLSNSNASSYYDPSAEAPSSSDYFYAGWGCIWVNGTKLTEDNVNQIADGFSFNFNKQEMTINGVDIENTRKSGSDFEKAGLFIGGDYRQSITLKVAGKNHIRSRYGIGFYYESSNGMTTSFLHNKNDSLVVQGGEQAYYSKMYECMEFKVEDFVRILGSEYYAGSDSEEISEIGSGLTKKKVEFENHTTYDLKIKGIEVTDENMNDVLGDGGTIKYKPATEKKDAVLILNNATIDVTDDYMAGIQNGIYPLSIVFKGKNRITTTDINTMSTVTSEQYDIKMYGTGSVELIGAYENIDFSTYNKGKFKAEVGQNAEHTKTYYDYILYNQPYKKISPYDHDTKFYPVWISDEQISDLNKNDVLGDGGKVKYVSATDTTEAKVLLKSAHLTDSDVCKSAVTSMEDLNINVEGENTITCTKGDGLTFVGDDYFGYNVFGLSGSGSLEIDCTQSDGYTTPNSSYLLTDDNSFKITYIGGDDKATALDTSFSSSHKYSKFTISPNHDVEQTNYFGFLQTLVTEDNKGDVLGDGKVSFVLDPDGKGGELTLNNVSCSKEYTGAGNGTGLFCKLFSLGAIDNLRIKLIGNNKIRCFGTWFFGINSFFADKISFVGNGSLTIQSSDMDIKWEPDEYDFSGLDGGHGKITCNDDQIVYDSCVPLECASYKIEPTNITGYPVFIGNVQVVSDNYDDVLGDGSISYEPATETEKAKLSLSSCDISNNISFYESAEVHVDGNCKITATNDEAITEKQSQENLVFTGNGSLEMTTDTGSVVSGLSFESFSKFNDGKYMIYAGDNAASAEQIFSPLCMSVDQMKYLKIQPSDERIYPLTIGSEAITDSNKNDIHFDALKEGTVSYDSETKTLTLSNTTWEQTTGYAIASDEDITIRLIGENSFTSEDTIICGNGKINIVGNGTLKMKTTGVQKSCISAGDKVSVQANLELFNDKNSVITCSTITGFTSGDKYLRAEAGISKDNAELVSVNNSSSKHYAKLTVKDNVEGTFDQQYVINGEANVEYSDYRRIAAIGDGEFTYSSSNPQIASVDKNTGRIYAKEIGDTTITATSTEGVYKPFSYVLHVTKKTINLVTDGKAFRKTYDGNANLTQQMKDIMTYQTEFDDPIGGTFAKVDISDAAFASADVGEETALTGISITNNNPEHYIMKCGVMGCIDPLPVDAIVTSKTNYAYGEERVAIAGTATYNGNSVPGSFSWIEGNTIQKTSGEQKWRFTPNNSNYATVTGTLNFTVAPYQSSNLWSAKFYENQVWDCFRSPAFPTAGRNFRVYNLKKPLDYLGKSISFASEDYVQFAATGKTVGDLKNANYIAGIITRASGCSKAEALESAVVSETLYNSNGTAKKTLARVGVIWSLDQKGFLYTAFGGAWEYSGGVGTYVTTSATHNGSSIVTEPTHSDPCTEDELNNEKIFQPDADKQETPETNISDISGRVITSSQIPVEGATVKFTNNGQVYTSTTDEFGNFIIPDIALEDYYCDVTIQKGTAGVVTFAHQIINLHGDNVFIYDSPSEAQDGNIKSMYSIQIITTEGGTVTPSESFTDVYEGSDKSYQLTADEGYELKEVYVDGEKRELDNVISFNNIEENHLIDVKFAKKINTTLNLTNLTADKVNGTIYEGEKYEVSLASASGYTLPEEISVKINSVTATPEKDYYYDSSNGKVVIYGDSIHGDVVISANGVASASLADTKFYEKQVWDCYRSPAFPASNKVITIYNLNNALDKNGRQISWSDGDYIKFEKTGKMIQDLSNGDSLADIMKNRAGISLEQAEKASVIKEVLYNSAGQVKKELASVGVIWKINDEGFLYTAFGGAWEYSGGVGTYVSNKALNPDSQISSDPWNWGDWDWLWDDDDWNNGSDHNNFKKDGDITVPENATIDFVGRVVDDEVTKNPIINANVSFTYNGQTYMRSTDSNGYFTIRDLEKTDTKCSVQIQKDNYAILTYDNCDLPKDGAVTFIYANPEVDGAGTIQTHSISTSLTNKDFGISAVGYTQAPQSETIKISNTGSSMLHLGCIASEHFTIGNYINTTVAPGQTSTFTIQPKVGLEKGTYEEKLYVNSQEGASAWILVKFEVDNIPVVPTAAPSIEPSSAPTVKPTTEPTSAPTVNPTTEPSSVPTVKPTTEPSSVPTLNPTIEPSSAPMVSPTLVPSTIPTVKPSEIVSDQLEVPKITVIRSDKDNSIQLGWDEIKGVDGYVIYVKENENDEWKEVERVTGTSYTYKNTEKNHVYYFTVRSFVGNKISGASEMEGFEAGAVAPQLNEVAVGTTWKNDSKLTWKKSKANVYTIYRSKTRNGKYKKIATVKGKAKYKIKGKKYRNYFYKVKVVASKKGSSIAGNINGKTIKKGKYYVGASYITKASKKGIIQLTPKSKVATYKVYGKISKISKYSTRYTLKPSVSQKLYVKVSKNGDYTLTAKTQKVDTMAAMLTWDSVPDATGYTIYRANGINGTMEKVATTGNVLSYTDKLSKPGIYAYRVSALLSDKESNKSIVRAYPVYQYNLKIKDSTYFETENGLIDGVDQSMEYSTDQKNWTPCNGTKLEDFAVGTYYIRHKETSELHADSGTAAVIHAEKGYRIPSITLTKVLGVAALST